MKSSIIDQIIAMLHSQSGDDLKTEAYWVFMNGCTCGNDEQIEFFVNNGVIDLLMSLLRNERQNLDVFDALECIVVGVSLRVDGRRREIVWRWRADRRTRTWR